MTIKIKESFRALIAEDLKATERWTDEITVRELVAGLFVEIEQALERSATWELIADRINTLTKLEQKVSAHTLKKYYLQIKKERETQPQSRKKSPRSKAKVGDKAQTPAPVQEISQPTSVPVGTASRARTLAQTDPALRSVEPEQDPTAGGSKSHSEPDPAPLPAVRPEPSEPTVSEILETIDVPARAKTQPIDLGFGAKSGRVRRSKVTFDP